jgi:predicted nucleic acid-binding protein
MTDEFVLDSSVALTWFFKDQASAETDLILRELGAGSCCAVAQHWRLEVTNVLLGAERAKKKTAGESTQFLALLEKLTIEVDQETDRSAGSATLALARKHKLTTYDAAYLELASRRGLPLATLDEELRKAAKTEGVLVLPHEVS